MTNEWHIFVARIRIWEVWRIGIRGIEDRKKRVIIYEYGKK